MNNTTNLEASDGYDYSLPHFSCWFCGQDIKAGVIPYFGTLGKPMCQACRCEMDGEFARQQARWAAEDLREGRAMELVRKAFINPHGD